MPERWEDEIRKLRELRPRQDLNARVAEGPRGEPSPPMRQRVVAAVTAFVVFVAAGFLVVRGFGTGGTDRPDPGQTSEAPVTPSALVLELHQGSGLGEAAPAGRLWFGELYQEGVVEEYSWCVGGECTSAIADFAFYPPASEYLLVPSGTTIDVVGDGMVESLHFTDTNGERVAGGGLSVVPEADGQYQVKVEASWDVGAETGSAILWFGVQVLSSPAAAPDVLHVDCGYGVAQADSAVVRTQADGLHIVFRGTDGFNGFEIVTAEGTPPFEIGGVGADFVADGSTLVPVPPGRWEVGCSADGEPVEAGDSTFAFELVDPDDHYAFVNMACQNVTEHEFASNISSSVGPQEAAAQLISGLGPDDRLRAGGYAADDFKPGRTYVVDRAGETIARLLLLEDETSYGGLLTACAESGITISEASGV